MKLSVIAFGGHVTPILLSNDAEKHTSWTDRTSFFLALSCHSMFMYCSGHSSIEIGSIGKQATFREPADTSVHVCDL